MSSDGLTTDAVTGVEAPSTSNQSLLHSHAVGCGVMLHSLACCGHAASAPHERPLTICDTANARSPCDASSLAQASGGLNACASLRHQVGQVITGGKVQQQGLLGAQGLCHRAHHLWRHGYRSKQVNSLPSVVMQWHVLRSHLLYCPTVSNAASLQLPERTELVSALLRWLRWLLLLLHHALLASPC